MPSSLGLGFLHGYKISIGNNHIYQASDYSVDADITP